MFWFGVAGGALCVGGRLGVLVRSVTRQARQLSGALEKATALTEIDRLMTDVPGIIKVGGDALGGRHAMALAAKIVYLRGLEVAGIPDVGR